MRLRRFVYDGVEAAAELDSTGAIQDRYVRGDGADEVLVDYAGSGTTNRRFLSSDERGSVISSTDSTGALLSINTYDEYGKPAAANMGRFQYTGQKWLSEIGAYDYKARVYLPHLGVFAQTDPVGQVDSPNLYAYVGDDPVNLTDPFGLAIGCVSSDDGVTWNCHDFGGGGSGQPAASGSGSGERGDIVIVGHRPHAHSNRQLCQSGNALEHLADKSGRASLVLGGTGFGLAGVGVFTDNPLAIGGGTALLGVGAALGELSGALQFTGGVAQGLSGRGFGNVLKAIASGGLGVLVSRGLRGSIPCGWHGQTRTLAISHNKVAGNAIAVAQQISNALAPTEVNCN